MNLCKTSLLKLLPVDKDIYFIPSSICCVYSAPAFGFLISGPAGQSTDLQALTDCIGLSLDLCISISSGSTVETVPGALRGALADKPIGTSHWGHPFGYQSVTLDYFTAQVFWWVD